MIIDDVDFSGMYREHIRLASRRSKPASDWDKRAEGIAQTGATPNDPYVLAFTARMQLDGAETLLDIGCGPGTICLPLAPHLKQVFALDYSRGMLDVLQQRAAARGISNVQCIQRSWDDGWDDVPVCDLVVASRSTMVSDLEDALKKLSAKAQRYVYTTHTVDRHFIVGDIMECLGRSTVGFPNYIYAVNLLYQMGYLPRVDFITTASCSQENKNKNSEEAASVEPSGFGRFLKSVQWSIGELSNKEVEKLKCYYEERGKNDTRLTSPNKTWAFVSWAV